jgi:hypothetical protein
MVSPVEEQQHGASGQVMCEFGYPPCMPCGCGPGVRRASLGEVEPAAPSGAALTRERFNSAFSGRARRMRTRSARPTTTVLQNTPNGTMTWLFSEQRCNFGAYLGRCASSHESLGQPVPGPTATKLYRGITV